MTVKLSPQKVAKILRYYFSGLLQMKIAKKSGVDQSSISIYATRFKERVSDVSRFHLEYCSFFWMPVNPSLSLTIISYRMGVREGFLLRKKRRI